MPTTEKRNLYPGYCRYCGKFLGPDEGVLEFCPADSGCLKHHDRSGYHVRCPDKERAACQERKKQRDERIQQQREMAEQREREETARRERARVALNDRLRGIREMGLVPISVRPHLAYVQDPGSGERYELPFGSWAILYRITLADGTDGFRLFHNTGLDMELEFFFLPVDAATKSLQTAVQQMGLSPKEARHRLEKWGEFYGSDVCRFAAGISPPWADIPLPGETDSGMEVTGVGQA